MERWESETFSEKSPQLVDTGVKEWTIRIDWTNVIRTKFWHSKRNISVVI